MSAATPNLRPPRQRELTCLIVEDQVLFSEMLSNLLNMRGGLRVVASALDVTGGKAACTKYRPDLLVLDLDLPDGNGLLVAEHLLELKPSARIIIVSGHGSDFVCPKWLNGPLQAIIGKNDTFAALRAELDEILSAGKKVAQPRGRKVFTDKPFTPRESEIFGLIGEGLTSKEIGDRLHLSGHTVQAHRKRIAHKLGTTGAELLQRAIAQRQALFSS